MRNPKCGEKEKREGALIDALKKKWGTRGRVLAFECRRIANPVSKKEMLNILERLPGRRIQALNELSLAAAYSHMGGNNSATCAYLGVDPSWISKKKRDKDGKFVKKKKEKND